MSRVIQMTYRPGSPGLPHVEVLDFGGLRRINRRATQRADFLVLAFITAGTGAVTIDFEQRALMPGSIAWIAPGTVHRWDDIEDLEGHLVLCETSSPLTSATRATVSAPRDPAVFVPAADEWRYVRAALDHLVLEVRPDVPGSTPELHAALLTALLARTPVDTVAARQDGVFERFLADVEAGFRQHRDVRHYAAELGYVERTLARKVRTATGRTAKAVIEERVVLEAKRLLIHHRMTAAACAIELGFQDPSAFSIFFRRVTGVRPGAWQSSQLER